MITVQREVFQITRRQFIKESNTLEDNAGINLLAEHQRVVHEGFKYPYKQCSPEFTVKGSLAKHQTAIHKGVEHPYRQCGHQFASKIYLAKHQRAALEGIKHPCGKVHVTRH